MSITTGSSRGFFLEGTTLVGKANALVSSAVRLRACSHAIIRARNPLSTHPVRTCTSTAADARSSRLTTSASPSSLPRALGRRRSAVGDRIQTTDHNRCPPPYRALHRTETYSTEIPSSKRRPVPPNTPDTGPRPDMEHHNDMRALREAEHVTRVSLRSTMRDKVLEWMAENPGHGQPGFTVNGSNMLYEEDPKNTQTDPYTGPPTCLGSDLTHTDWADVLTELQTDYGVAVLRTQPELAKAAAMGVALARNGNVTKDEINEITALQFAKLAKYAANLPASKRGAEHNRVGKVPSSKSMKAAAKREARDAKKGGDTAAQLAQREHDMKVAAMRVLHEDMSFNMAARAHNRQIAELKEQSQFVLEMKDPPSQRPDGGSRRLADGGSRRLVDEPRVEPRVEPTKEDKARSKYQSWGRHLVKSDRQSRLATAWNAFEEEKRREVRAACDASAEAKLARQEAALDNRKPGPSGPSKPAAWGEEAPGISEQSKAKGEREESFEKAAEHAHALRQKEAQRIAELETQKEFRRKAFEIGGSRA